MGYLIVCENESNYSEVVYKNVVVREFVIFKWLFFCHINFQNRYYLNAHKSRECLKNDEEVKNIFSVVLNLNSYK